MTIDQRNSAGVRLVSATQGDTITERLDAMAEVRHCQRARAIDRFPPACYPTHVIRLCRAGSLAFLLVGLVTSAVHGEPRRWVTVAGKSEVSFAATHPLGNFVGRTESVTGVFRADPENLRRPVSGTLQVNAATLKTGDDARDRDMWKLLAVEKHAEIRFNVERVEPSFHSVAERSDVLLK